MKVIVLDATDKLLEVVMSGAPATTNPDFTVHYADSTSTTFEEKAADGTLNGTTPVTFVAAPAASTRRIVKEFTIVNVDTAAVTITITYESGANSRRLWYGTLQPDETLTSDGTFDENGALKTAIATIPAHGHTGSSDGGQLNAGNVFSAGTLPHERGGLEADVSAYSGLVKITGGATSAVTAPSGAVVGDTDTQTLTNKTLTTPTIGDFTNATHNHTNAAGGGQITDAALSAAVGVGKGGLGITTTPTNGQIPIGNGTNYVAAAITAGAGVSVTNGAGSITIARAAAPFAIIEEQQAQNTAGGTSNATTWTTRVLNTEVVDANNIVTLSSNQFTPIAGTYKIFINSPFVGSSTTTAHGRIRLRNVTAGTVVLVSANHALLVNTQSNMTMMAGFDANGTDAYDIQYYVTVGRATNGLGIGVNETSAVERYTQAFLEKIG